MNIVVLYVGSSLLSPLRKAQREIEDKYHLRLRLHPHSCTLPLSDPQWALVERNLQQADIVFVLHVTDPENAGHIIEILNQHRARHRAVIVINCLGELMRCTRLGPADFATIFRSPAPDTPGPVSKAIHRAMSWMSRARGQDARRAAERYLGLFVRLPAVLRFIPPAGKLAPIKQYLTLFCYFLQPTAANIQAMLLYAIQSFAPVQGMRIQAPAPKRAPFTGIYHPDAPGLFGSFEQYRDWYERLPRMSRLDSERTVGLLLLRPQVVSEARHHYDAMIRELEAEGLGVLPILSTFMDNRQACQTYLIDPSDRAPRVSQLLSLTGFSFVGGPAMNDSKAAVAFLSAFNRPLHCSVSLETQTIGHWDKSMIGLNPVQAAMQVAIPEIDGATEPFVFGGLPDAGEEPEAIPDRCRRIARRIARWNRLRLLPRNQVRLALIVYCFPPDKGNLGTAAGLDVFPSLLQVLRRLHTEGYTVDVPETTEALRNLILDDGPDSGAGLAHVAYRLPAEEYYRLCPYVSEIEAEWGPAPGRINSNGLDILIHGVHFGNLFIGVQPTFGYEGDPMRLQMAMGPTPHHGFMGLYTYLDKVLKADALVHIGTHGALEFMPGKQAGLSGSCWPDRLIGDFPNVYLYSVNNPSEGSIAKRRSYAELVSYLTPPIEAAGLYRDLAALKDLLAAYRESRNAGQRDDLFAEIRSLAKTLHLSDGPRVLSYACETNSLFTC